MSELARFINKFISNHEVMYKGSQESEFDKLMQYFNSEIETFDRPDGFCKYDNNVLIIEHFEFDSSFKNRKGSKNRQEIFRTSNVKLDKQKKFQTFRDEIKCDFTIENYIDNAINNLNLHYAKIEKYKEHLKNENIITNETNIETLFCIEDTTVLGNIDDEKGNPIFLVNCEEFINKIKKCKNLNYILCGSSYGNNDFTWFSSVLNIENYQNHQYNKNNIKIANLNPQTMSFIEKI